jgi:hypothetical protein
LRGDGQAIAVQGRKGGRAGEREREEAPAALRYRLHPVDSRASRAVARTVALGFGRPVPCFNALADIFGQLLWLPH